MTFKRQFDPNYIPSKGEVNELPSLTRPNMSLTVYELLKNHTRSMSLGVNANEGHYFETEIHRHSDLVDEMEYKEELADRIKETKQKAEQELKDARQASLKAQKEKEAQDLEKAEKLLKKAGKLPEKPN